MPVCVKELFEGALKWSDVALLAGPGVACPKSRPQGVEPATLAKSRPVCPPGPV
jgi:hypothetical protein